MTLQMILSWMKSRLAGTQGVTTLSPAHHDAPCAVARWQCHIEHLAFGGLPGEARWHIEFYLDRLGRMERS